MRIRETGHRMKQPDTIGDTHTGSVGIVVFMYTVMSFRNICARKIFSAEYLL